MKKNGIDISRWQEHVDFNVLKHVDRINFIILKCGGSDKSRYIDKTFYSSYMQCKKYDIPVGAYYFVSPKCNCIEAGYADAIAFIDAIKGLQFEYPIYMDFEAPDTSNKIGNTNAVIAFCETCEQHGYYVGVYASDISGFRDRLDLSRLMSYDKWVARYGNEPLNVQNYGMWQYSSNGRLNGIQGRVDLDVAFKNYPAIIKNKHLNGF